jgi:3-phosphoshikimate 1-carboxyvinyltransferase
MILRVDSPAPPLCGELRPPGDKSVSHRALIFGCLADGESRVTGLLEGEDVLATLEACRQLGLEARKTGDTWILKGVGRDGLHAPNAPLDMGNSGTAMRLLAGVLAAQRFDSVLIGDDSLSRRPMNRIVHPLKLMGARIKTDPDGTPPLRIHGNPALEGIEYASPVASAQVKSCLLLAGLYARGRTAVREPHLSRDHTERMLPAFGVDLAGDRAVTGGGRLQGAQVVVPGDISSAAFFLVAAALVPGSDLLLRNVGLNATRDGIIRVMKEMGADIELNDLRESGGEPIGDVRVRYTGPLRNVEISAEQVPALIDELPVIFALAAAGEGTLRLRGAAELRVKESDRLAVMAQGLRELGVAVEEYPDGIDITGGAIGGGTVDGAGDHRCAMSFCILGQVASGPVTVTGARNIATSYPGFADDLARLGGQLRRVE